MLITADEARRSLFCGGATYEGNSTHCNGNYCAMWRWKDTHRTVKSGAGFGNNVKEEIPVAERVGYCGRGGRP